MPIPKNVIDDVVAALVRFKIVCADLGVPTKNIHIVATEATREAINSAEFMKDIHNATGLSVQLLEKAEEGRIGALGIASGYSEIEGLIMDLGGGSTQFSWMVYQGGNVRMSDKGSFSFPYGAAALTMKLDKLKHGKSKDDAQRAMDKLRDEMTDHFRDAFHKLKVPQSMMDRAKDKGGFPLYLTGGGFRGWGYLLLYMDQVHGHHYPISIINGYRVSRERFENTESLEETARAAHSVFRVSDRRRKQVPAVAFLVNVLSKAIPHGIKEAHFCQGGVREGMLFGQLSPTVRVRDPLEVVTERFAPQSADGIFALLMSATPRKTEVAEKRFPEEISTHVIRAFTNVLYVHGVMDSELASTAALYSTSMGLMSSTRGVSHEDRARLALMLESRYRGELPPREVQFKEALCHVIKAEQVWWACYLGRVGYLVSRLYPAGKIEEMKPRVLFSAEVAGDLGRKRDKEGLRLTVSIQKMDHDPSKLKRALEEHVRVIESIGKKKNWVGGSGHEEWGMKVEVVVVEEGIM